MPITEFLLAPSLIFDCLVPKFQKPMDIPADKRKQYRLPRRGDPPEWYHRALEMDTTSRARLASSVIPRTANGGNAS